MLSSVGKCQIALFWLDALCSAVHNPGAAACHGCRSRAKEATMRMGFGLPQSGAAAGTENLIRVAQQAEQQAAKV